MGRSDTQKYLGKQDFLVNLRNSIQTQPVPNFFGTQTQLNPAQTHHYADQYRCLHLIGLQIDKKCFSTVFFP